MAINNQTRKFKRVFCFMMPNVKLSHPERATGVYW